MQYLKLILLFWKVLLVACLGLRTHFRFKRLIALSQRIRGSGQRTILVKMSYFKDMNRLMSFILLSYSAGFIILCVDALTSNMVINKSKFAMDVLIANTNVCTVYLLIILVNRNPMLLQKKRKHSCSSYSIDIHFSSSSSICKSWPKRNNIQQWLKCSKYDNVNWQR